MFVSRLLRRPVSVSFVARSSSGVSLSASSSLASCRSSVSRLFSSSSQAGKPALSSLLTTKLNVQDPEIFDIIEQEKRRQRDSIALIPSENFTSSAVLEALGSIMQNKYSEGYPGARYYGGNEFIDKAEIQCQQRALNLFKLDQQKWGVNVQALSGSPANFEVYTAVLHPHDRIMSLDLPHGGHLSHGYSTPTKKISAVSTYFEVLPYRLDESTGLIDYDTLTKNAILYRPKLIVCGASAYARHIDYKKMRQIADLNNSLLLTDMAHISGLVAAGVMPSPFEFSDIVTTTTHKSLRGPRGAMIFFRRGERRVDKGVPVMYDLEDRINASVFPGHQGGPHNHTITALAVALKQAATPEFVEYQKTVLLNNKAMADAFTALGYKLVSGGTDNHLILVDLRPKGLTGSKVETVCSAVNIALNKNTVPGDSSALNPGGIRVGSPALTSRGLVSDDFVSVVRLVDDAVKISLSIQSSLPKSSKLSDFKAVVTKQSAETGSPVYKLREAVVEFARKFPAVGFNEEQMKYKL